MTGSSAEVLEVGPGEDTPRVSVGLKIVTVVVLVVEAIAVDTEGYTKVVNLAVASVTVTKTVDFAGDGLELPEFPPTMTVVKTVLVTVTGAVTVDTNVGSTFSVTVIMPLVTVTKAVAVSRGSRLSGPSSLSSSSSFRSSSSRPSSVTVSSFPRPYSEF